MTTETATRKSIYDFETIMIGRIQIRLDQGNSMEGIVTEILETYPMCFSHIGFHDEIEESARAYVQTEIDERNSVYNHDWL